LPLCRRNGPGVTLGFGAMDQAILRALAAEVQSRKCPGCGNSLRHADISAHFAGKDKVQLHFRCRFCVFEGGGEIELTAEIYKEAAEMPLPEERDHVRIDPAGERVAYQLSWGDGNERRNRGQVCWCALAPDAEPVQATKGRRDHSPEWSPDGRRLAYVGRQGPRDQLFVLDLQAE